MGSSGNLAACALAVLGLAAAAVPAQAAPSAPPTPRVTSSPSEAVADITAAAQALRDRTSTKPLQVRLTGSGAFTLYLAPNGSSRLTTPFATRICKPPREDGTVRCWQQLGQGTPWEKKEVPASTVSRDYLVQVAANKITGFVEYGTGLTYTKTGSAQNLNATLSG